MSKLGSLPVYIDPWEIDYGDQAPVTASDSEPPQTDASVEIPAAKWAPVQPASVADFHKVCIVDGTRRLEARLHLQHEDDIVPGAFGSCAVGAVALSEGRAWIEETRLRHLAILGAKQTFPAPIEVRPGLVYQPESTPDSTPDAAMQHLQNSMRQLEAELATSLAAADTLIISDGPLRFDTPIEHPAVGYIKRIHELYIDTALHPVLWRLPAATRSPVFLINTSQPHYSVYAWFVRLDKPLRGSSPLHGLVRLECDARVGIERACALANFTTRWLPGVASQRGRDPRAPQNLLPIGALENHLRRSLADRKLVRRWIEALVFSESAGNSPGHTATTITSPSTEPQP